MRSTWSTWSAVINLEPRAGELRSAPSTSVFLLAMAARSPATAPARPSAALQPLLSESPPRPPLRPSELAVFKQTLSDLQLHRIDELGFNHSSRADAVLPLSRRG